MLDVRFKLKIIILRSYAQYASNTSSFVLLIIVLE